MRAVARAILCLAVLAGGAQAAAQALLQAGDLSYLGAFAAPSGEEWAWGGHALTYLPAGDPAGPPDGHPGSLYIAGHAQYDLVGEISIPAPVITDDLLSLPAAGVLRAPTDITGGLLAAVCASCASCDPTCFSFDVGGLAYLALGLLILASAMRPLAQFTAFDFVVTVALGASFGRILTARDVGLAEAVTAFALLVALQYLMTTLERRSPRVARLVAAPPSLLYYRGRFLEDEMRRERATEAAVYSAVRQQGLGSLEPVEAIVLESGGGLAIIQSAQVGDGAALRGLRPD